MIATVTLNPAVDHTVAVAQLVADEVTRVDEVQFDPGGKGINVSQFLAAMDVETVSTGVLGGFTGRFITDSLADAEIVTEFIDIDGRTRMNSSLLTDSGEYKFNERGPRVTGDDVGEIVATLERLGPETVVVAGSLPPGLDSEAIDRIARAGPWETAVDVDGPLLRSLTARYEWCKPNVPELEAATGQQIEGVEDAERAATELRQTGFDHVVASLGADGAILVSPETAVHEPAIECDVVDTVGAGDALLSGVLAATAAGADEASALRAGVVTATAAVSTRGTTIPALPKPTASGLEPE